ncbi:MAG: GH39 family glycosyl hydrolase [Acidobacteriaceae bacterium]
MRTFTGILLAVVAAVIAAPAFAVPPPSNANAVNVTATWNHVERVSDTIPTTQHLASAYTLRSNPLNKPLLKALRDLHTQDTRLQLWYTVPRQAVAELKEPTATETFWNFKYIDPLFSDFYANTSGRRHVNFGTIPRWMFEVPPIDVPIDPGASFHAYAKGTTGALLKDPSGQQFAAYQVRIYKWYTQGGFTDEIGKYHRSGHHYKISYWDVLNEPDFENKITVEQYTKIYDAVTQAIHKIDANVQFFGPEISGAEVPWARYFLNPKNHAPGALPVEWFSFHNYVDAPNDPATWQARYFTGQPSSATDGAPAQALVGRIQHVLKIRDELSPKTKVIIDELGTFNLVKPGEDACSAVEPYRAYKPLYWVAIGANWADNFITAEKLGSPIFSMSQLLGYPTQCLSITMVNWDTAHPNAHYWVLKLINDNFGPGDKLVRTESSSPDVVAQASITRSGRKLLLVNTSDRTVTVDLSNSYRGAGLGAEVVDEASGEQPPRNEQVMKQHITLAPFATAVVSQATK